VIGAKYKLPANSNIIQKWKSACNMEIGFISSVRTSCSTTGTPIGKYRWNVLWAYMKHVKCLPTKQERLFSYSHSLMAAVIFFDNIYPTGFQWHQGVQGCFMASQLNWIKFSNGTASCAILLDCYHLLHLQRFYLSVVEWNRVYYWPILQAADDNWRWVWSNRWNDWQEKANYSEETFPSFALYTKNPT
jgi:hypothetical protein